MDKKWLIAFNEKTLRCYLCGLLITRREDCTADHVIAKKKGGTVRRPSHFWCNQAKGMSDKLTPEALLTLIQKWHKNSTPFPDDAWDSYTSLVKRDERPKEEYAWDRIEDSIKKSDAKIDQMIRDNAPAECIFRELDIERILIKLLNQRKNKQK